MERIGSRRAAQESGESGDGTSAERAGGVRAAAVAVAVAAALAGCSVTVQPKNAAASRPLSTSQTPTAPAASTPAAPSSSAPPTSASPTPAPSDVDHTACGNVRDALATLKQKLETDKDSAHRTATDYRNAGYNLRQQANKTKNADLKTTLQAVANDYYTVGSDASRQDSTEADLAKVADASKPLSTLCGGS